MCITSVTISHKAISSGVECACSSRKQEKYSSVWLGQLPVNPEKQLLLQQHTRLVPLFQSWSTCPTAASEFKKRDDLFRERRAMIRKRIPTPKQICSLFTACQTLPWASAAVCAAGAPVQVWTSQCAKHSSSLVFISLTPPPSHFPLFFGRVKYILHRLFQSGFYRDRLLILLLYSANIPFPSFFCVPPLGQQKSMCLKWDR